jgi:hypothetical protein
MYHEDRGFTFLAIMYSLPYALLMWGCVSVPLTIRCGLIALMQHVIILGGLFINVSVAH